MTPAEGTLGATLIICRFLFLYVHNPVFFFPVVNVVSFVVGAVGDEWAFNPAIIAIRRTGQEAPLLFNLNACGKRPLMAPKEQGQANPTMDSFIRAAVTLSRIPRLKKLIPLHALELSSFLVADYLILSYFTTGVPDFEGKIIYLI